MADTTVLAITGSLRAGSLNRLLVQAAAGLAPPAMTIEAYPTLRDLPGYDADLDTDQPLAAVAELRRGIAAADGLLLATPEYNHGMPGVLKNALDWASTPPHASVLADKPTAVMGASPSPFGTARAQANLRLVLAGTGSRVLAGPEVMVFSAHERFDAGGHLTDKTAAGFLSGLLQALHDEIRRADLVPAAT